VVRSEDVFYNSTPDKGVRVREIEKGGKDEWGIESRDLLGDAGFEYGLTIVEIRLGRGYGEYAS
jgi:hypothetical protein